jgi:hypothetical protein
LYKSIHLVIYQLQGCNLKVCFIVGRSKSLFSSIIDGIAANMYLIIQTSKCHMLHEENVAAGRFKGIVSRDSVSTETIGAKFRPKQYAAL